MSCAFVGLGANLGTPLATLRAAREALKAQPGIELRASSSIYRSAAVGPGAQPDYLNAVLELQTTLDAATLLQRLHALEDTAGRQRGERWGPRTLDLDLLLFGSETIDSATLQVPHPRLFERNFVLLPLSELRPSGWRFPDGSTIDARCAACADNPIERTELGWHTAAEDPSITSGNRPWPR